MTTPDKPVNIINHVALVLDASSSMQGLTSAVVRVADKLIADLADMSRPDPRTGRRGQETRVTVYTFADEVNCAFYDMDVERLRHESITEHYNAEGNTALLRATSDAIDDLAMTPEKYGDHSFLLYIITDGEENVSDKQLRPGGWYSYTDRPGPSYQDTLPKKIAALADHWTLGCFVPNSQGVFRAKKYGFPAGNIAVWDTTSSAGVEEVGRTITAATQTYMTSRASGLRGTKSLFTTNTGTIDTSAVKAAGLAPLDTNSYVLSPVLARTTTSEFVAEYRKMHPDHAIGDVFYQLTGSSPTKGKRGIIVQGYKPVAVMERSSGRVWTGPEARRLVGLPDHTVTVDPKDEKGDYLLFVRSDASNRILYPGTQFLMMKK